MPAIPPRWALCIKHSVRKNLRLDPLQAKLCAWWLLTGLSAMPPAWKKSWAPGAELSLYFTERPLKKWELPDTHVCVLKTHRHAVLIALRARGCRRWLRVPPLVAQMLVAAAGLERCARVWWRVCWQEMPSCPAVALGSLCLGGISVSVPSTGSQAGVHHVAQELWSWAQLFVWPSLVMTVGADEDLSSGWLRSTVLGCREGRHDQA